MSADAAAPTFDGYVAVSLAGLLRYAGALTADRHLAEDLVQEVLLKAHQNWDRVAGARSIDAYVRRMIANQYVSWYRKWGRVIPFTELVERRAKTHADSSEAVTDRDDLMGRLRTLPPRQRTVLVLRFYEGLSDDEIADALGCSSGTVRAHASRALATLRVAEQRCPSTSPGARGDRAFTSPTRSDATFRRSC